MIIKMRKEVFISGTFVNAFRYEDVNMVMMNVNPSIKKLLDLMYPI